MSLKVVFFCLCLSAFLIPGSWLPDSLVVPILLDLLHYPAFLMLGIYVYFFFPNYKRNYLLLAALTVIVELIQPLIGRSASLQDILMGELGLLTAYSLTSGLNIKVKLFSTFIFIGSYIFILALSLYGPIQKSLHSENLGTFESSWDMFGWRNVNHITSDPLAQEYIQSRSSTVLIGKKLEYDWSGVSYEWPIAANFKSNQHLSFDFYSEINFKELDIKFQFIGGKNKIKTLKNIKAGWQLIHSPLANSDNASTDIWLKKVSIYYESSSGPDWYYIDNVQIE